MLPNAVLASRAGAVIEGLNTSTVSCLVVFPPQYSICNEPLIELSNPGASGSLFYLTSDDEFIVKTVQHKEAEFLQKLLPGYYMVSPPSLLPACLPVCLSVYLSV